MDESMETDPQYLDDETTCAICYAEFLDTEDLNIHITQLHLNETSIKRFCNHCHSIFPDIQAYVLHLKDYHIKHMKWCKYCTRVFFNDVDLEEHELKHGELLVKSCSQCSQSFLNNEELEVHEYRSHKDHVSNEGIMLQECFPMLSSVLHMNVRTFFSVPHSHEMYSCVFCGLVTSEIEVYLQHLKLEDTNVYVCDMCNNVFKEKYKLIRHIKHSCEDDDIYLQEHNISKKLDKKMLRKNRKQSLSLKRDNSNLKLNNTVTPNYNRTIPLLTCNFCFRQFVGNIALKKHIDRAHKASFHLYKYKCILCEQVFKHPKLLFTHYFSKHKELHPYTCKICDKKFRVRKTFTLHIKLDHKSVGFVEFDENYHVFFSDKKSDNPFQPQSLISESNEKEEEEPNKVKSDLTNEIDLTNVNSDFMNPTETECDTDVDRKQKKLTLKSKRPKKLLTKHIKKTKPNYETELSSNDSDAPLITIRRKSAQRYTKIMSLKKFVCPKCNKNCYTYQNYHHHMSLHTGCKLKSCIKCDKKFKSKEALDKHIERKHTSSKLTETLKQLLERRKNPHNLPKDRQSLSEGFRRRIEKGHVDECIYSPAEIKLVDNRLSAKKFIESFIPEESSKDIKITSSITLKEVYNTDNSYKTQKIIMTKFTPEPTVVKNKLRMPVKFKHENTDHVKASIKLVQELTSITKPLLTFTSEAHVDHSYTDAYENDYMAADDREEIPEVAEEVMLNEDERGGEEWEQNKSIEKQNSIIIPNLPENYEDVRIGHLQSQAPYYKIVKMQDVLKSTETPTKPAAKTLSNVTLPDGTKLVTVNPLAHLLGNTSVEEILKANKKHYEPKIKDIKTAMEKAMKTVYKPKRQRQNIC